MAETCKKLNVSRMCYLIIVSLLMSYFVSELSQSDGKHDILTVCDGEDASFSWPCDLQYDLAKTMTLTFNGLNTQRESVATITSDGNVTVSEAYSDRVRARGTSGVHVDNIGILDSGMYVTRAEFYNGTTVERRFTLSVLGEFFCFVFSVALRPLSLCYIVSVVIW